MEPAAHSRDLNLAKSQNYMTGPYKLAHRQNGILRRAYNWGCKKIVRKSWGKVPIQNTRQREMVSCCRKTTLAHLELWPDLEVDCCTYRRPSTWLRRNFVYISCWTTTLCYLRIPTGSSSSAERGTCQKRVHYWSVQSSWSGYEHRCSAETWR